MFPSRRSLLQGAGLGSLSGLWPFRKLAAAPRKSAGVYEQLGIRPVVNFQGTHTTIGASKVWPEIHDAMAEASRHYVYLEELQEAIGERLARLMNTEAAMVTTGAAGAISLGTCAALTGDDVAKVRRLPDLAGMRTEVIIQKPHRNGYDHAVRNAGVRIVEVDNAGQLAAAAGAQTAMMYYLGGSSHDWEWETPVPLEECLEIARNAGFPVMVDAANMLPPWDNIRKLGALGVDLICLSGGKHMRGPQCSGILAGRKDLIRAAWLNSSPHSDSLGRPMKVGREEMIGVWLAAEKYSKLDFAAIERQSAQQADYIIAELGRIPGVKTARTPFDRTRRVHRVVVTWDETARNLATGDVIRRLKEGDPRVVVLKAAGQGIELTVFMNEPGDEKIAVRRLKEVFSS
ncbi:MAG: aminotransferase class V-fold PLP-dependent enzyme [Bryobacteraceae bacterium]|nr:aminotransferase class V-fold PLP-dependent enzyme [Bryobacteraceae bacterium]